MPLQDVGVSVTNQMSAAQGVYVEDGVTADNDTVSAGDFGSLNPNYIVLDSLGEGTYRWKAGFPNIISPYQMGMTIYYNYNGSMNGWSENNNFKGIVLGELPSGNNFVTSGPDKVLMILRDPAGTGSSSFWEEGVTVTTEEVDGGSFISNNEITTETKFGAMLTTIAGTPGFGVVTEAGIENTLEVGIHVNGTRTSTDTWTTTITTTNKIRIPSNICT